MPKAIFHILKGASYPDHGSEVQIWRVGFVVAASPRMHKTCACHMHGRISSYVEGLGLCIAGV